MKKTLLSLLFLVLSGLAFANPPGTYQPLLIYNCTPTLIAGATGTNIGTLTSGGGLAASFDGVTSKTGAASSISGVTSTAYIGKNYSPVLSIFSAQVYAPNNVGISGGDNQTINLRAKQTAPSTPADGILLGTTGPQTDPGASSIFTIITNDHSTKWAYVWFELIDNTAPTAFRTAQVIFTGCL